VFWRKYSMFTIFWTILVAKYLMLLSESKNSLPGRHEKNYNL